MSYSSGSSREPEQMNRKLTVNSLVLSRFKFAAHLVDNMSQHRRSLRFAKTTCPVCGAKEVARDDHKGDLLCTNCGHIIVREETRATGKFDIAQILKREGKMDFDALRRATGAANASLYTVLQNMVNMGLLQEIMGQYSLTKQGQRWYRQRLGQEWGY